MKKIIGFIFLIICVIIFLSLYFLTVLFKESDNIGLIIMGVGYVGVALFIIGIMLIRNNKKEK
jgi:hypothetical protein